MKSGRTGFQKWIVLAVLVVLIACTCRVTLVWDAAPAVSVNEQGEEVAAVDLTPAEQYCADNWTSRMLPTITEKAVDTARVLTGAQADLNALGAECGERANETSAWNFCVTGKAVVLSVENPEKASKTRLTVDVEPFDGAADCQIQWSSVIKSNAVRDAVGFLHLDDFENQVAFAELTKAFNARIQRDLITQTEAASLAGKTVAFTGCVALSKMTAPEDAQIIPVALTEVA